MSRTLPYSPFIQIVTLGCSKNTVDSEFLGGALKAAGCRVSHEDQSGYQDAVIINTCGFILDAKEESIDTILHHARRKQGGLVGKLLVVGCLAQRYHAELSEELKEADAVLGINYLQDVLEILAPNPQIGPLSPSRLLSTPSHYAWLKVSEGCDRRCSFCAIPAIRGTHLSRDIEGLVREVEQLTDKGAREIILIAQDLTAYGKDLYGKPALPRLLKALLHQSAPDWIRLHYAYPTGVTDELLDLLVNEPRVCAYLDVPFQHIHDRILKAMHRGHTREDIIRLMDKIRNNYPGVAVRTTMIVGYPGETDQEFNALLDFVKHYRFERLGAFKYSHEEGTPAFTSKDNVPEAVKQTRMQTIMNLQEDISYTHNQAFIGRTLRVLVDESLPDGYFLARTEYDSPEIDNEVIVAPHPELEVGSFAQVRITAASAFDLNAEKVTTFESTR